MVNIEMVWTGAEFVIAAMSSAGVKVIVDEAVEKLTPENLSAIKKCCVEAAKWGGTTAVGAACAYGIHKNVENAKKVTNKAISIFDRKTEKDAEPIIEATEDNNPVEIEEPETEE